MLNWADLVLLGILAISTLVGLWRGLVVEVLSLVAWIAAFWLAFRYGAHAAGWFGNAIDSPAARLFLAYALVFVLALVVGGLATWLVSTLVRSTGLSGTDRIFGLGFGLVRGAALCTVLVLVLGFTPAPGDDWWRESRLLPGFQAGAEWMRAWLPEAAAEYLDYRPYSATGLSADAIERTPQGD